MPFDGNEGKVTARMRGYQLVHELRNLPKSHDWNYNHVGGKTFCGSNGCALGYADYKWPELFKKTLRRDRAAFFGLTLEQYEDIFLGTGNWRRCEMRKVTPYMVADALEEELNNAV